MSLRRLVRGALVCALVCAAAVSVRASTLGLVDSTSPECRAKMMTCQPGGPCPDIVLDGPRAQASRQVVINEFTADSCAVVEGCTQPGKRKLLRFDLASANVGTADLVIGNPFLPELAPCFEWSPCHNHHHFTAYADYTLFKDGHTIARGSKASSCVMDAYRWPNSTAPIKEQNKLYNCQNQGLTMGYQDVYSGHLDCQWIDVTGVTPGDYTMLIEVNRARVLAESNYDNNAISFTVNIPPDSDIPGPVDPESCTVQGGCSSCTNSRGCGWCSALGYCAFGDWLGPATGSCSEWTWSAAQCMAEAPGGGQTDRVCSVKTDCASCSQESGCGWCSATNKCSAGFAGGPTYESGASCPNGWVFGSSSQCRVDNCPQQDSCGVCTNTPHCGWCTTTGKCAWGTWLGPADTTCFQWKWGVSQCVNTPAPENPCRGSSILMEGATVRGNCPAGINELGSGQDCLLGCKPGFSNNDPNRGRMMCTDGTWSGLQPNCIPDPCTMPPVPVGTNIGCSVGTILPSGSQFTYGIKKGYKLESGSLTRKCLAGAFDQPAPRMVRADSPPPSENVEQLPSTDSGSGTGNTVNTLSRAHHAPQELFADAPAADDAAAASPAADVCASKDSCAACSNTEGCGWCSETNSCAAGTWVGPTSASASDSADSTAVAPAAPTCPFSAWRWSFQSCYPAPPSLDTLCASTGAKSCAACTTIPGCGWCPTSGKCTSGSWVGDGKDSQHTCDAFVWTSASCSAAATLDAQPNPSLATLARAASSHLGRDLESTLSHATLATLESLRLAGGVEPQALLESYNSPGGLNGLLKSDPRGNVFKTSLGTASGIAGSDRSDDGSLSEGLKKDPTGNFLKHRTDIDLDRVERPAHLIAGGNSPAMAASSQRRSAAAAPASAESGEIIMDRFPRQVVSRYDPDPFNPNFPHGHIEHHAHTHAGQTEEELAQRLTPGSITAGSALHMHAAHPTQAVHMGTTTPAPAQSQAPARAARVFSTATDGHECDGEDEPEDPPSSTAMPEPSSSSSSTAEAGESSSSSSTGVDENGSTDSTAPPQGGNELPGDSSTGPTNGGPTGDVGVVRPVNSASGVSASSALFVTACVALVQLLNARW